MPQTRLGAARVNARRCGIKLDDYLARQARGLKWCYRCLAWKPVGEFGGDRSRGDGRDPLCLQCRRVTDPKSTKGRVSPFKGMVHTAEARQKMSAAKKRHPGNHRTLHTLETRQKISQVTRERTPRGAACHSYKDGKLAERRDQRFSMLYKRWRFDVFIRDHFTCQHCGDAQGGNLRAHHLKGFAAYPDLRFDIPNGITLCDACHLALHRGEWSPVS